MLYHQLCLILTPECIVPEEGEGNEEEGNRERGYKGGCGMMIKKDSMERIERFSMLVARPVGVVVFLMDGRDGGGGGGDGGMREYMIFMNWSVLSTFPFEGGRGREGPGEIVLILGGF